MQNESRFDDLELREEPPRGEDYANARFSQVHCTQNTFGCGTLGFLTGGCCE
jgi:hypothetical protein